MSQNIELDGVWWQRSWISNPAIQSCVSVRRILGKNKMR